jgi:hypothetical protein
MRRGSVSERYVRCNKPSCACRERDEARHGPYYSVSRVVKGTTRSRWLGGEQAKIVREQVETGQQFRKTIEAYWEACEQWADAELEPSEATSHEVAEKGGSKPRLTRRSRARSRRW